MAKSDGAYRTIAEVATQLELPASVLRFWETQFSQVKPVKRMGRRYYSSDDIALLERIKHDLYREGYTIKGVQKRLKEDSERMVEVSPPPTSDQVEAFVREVSDVRDYLTRYL